jgi:hypothetical protein
VGQACPPSKLPQASFVVSSINLQAKVDVTCFPCSGRISRGLPGSLAFIDKVRLLTGMWALFNLGQEYSLNIFFQNGLTGGHRD